MPSVNASRKGFPYDLRKEAIGTPKLVDWGERSEYVDGKATGRTAGIYVECVFPKRAFLSQRINIDEPTITLPEELPEQGLDVELINFQVSAYVPQGGRRVAYSATADDIRIANVGGGRVASAHEDK